jgi:quercetin dioxygenase-like cupin family protein
MTPFRVIALDEIEALPGPDTLTWRPVRRTLGFRAFGTNAYTAARAGDDVVEPHTEDDHEELYFVFRGRARFILDGEEVDVPAGSYVHLPDPSVHRHAVALEDGTTVMSFGGPPNFEPSEWEERFVLWGRARQAALRGDREEALANLRTALEMRPSDASEARDHPDFASLRDDEEFVALVTR